MNALPPAPPPGPELLGALGAMRPVGTRVPWRTAALLAAACVAIPAATTGVMGLRGDFHALPWPWIGAVAALWLAAIAVTLFAAVVPRRGDVLPDASRAVRVATAVAGALVLFGLVATFDAPGATTIPETSWRGFWGAFRHCAPLGLELALPVIVMAGVALRRLHPMGGRRIAIALGAVGGMASGLALHFVCGVGGGLHVAFAHGGGVVLAAVAGFLLLRRVLRM